MDGSLLVCMVLQSRASLSWFSAAETVQSMAVACDSDTHTHTHTLVLICFLFYSKNDNVYFSSLIDSHFCRREFLFRAVFWEGSLQGCFRRRGIKRHRSRRQLPSPLIFAFSLWCQPTIQHSALDLARDSGSKPNATHLKKWNHFHQNHLLLLFHFSIISLCVMIFHLEFPARQHQEKRRRKEEVQGFGTVQHGFLRSEKTDRQTVWGIRDGRMHGKGYSSPFGIWCGKSRLVDDSLGEFCWAFYRFNAEGRRRCQWSLACDRGDAHFACWDVDHLDPWFERMDWISLIRVAPRVWNPAVFRRDEIFVRGFSYWPG